MTCCGFKVAAGFKLEGWNTSPQRWVHQLLYSVFPDSFTLPSCWNVSYFLPRLHVTLLYFNISYPLSQNNGSESELLKKKNKCAVMLNVISAPRGFFLLGPCWWLIVQQRELIIKDLPLHTSRFKHAPAASTKDKIFCGITLIWIYVTLYESRPTS